MTLANPIFLWSLWGLSIPIVIHLLSRKEGKIIRIGSIRHIQETSTQQFKGVKLNEILLLILRCAMIIVFSLLLSGLQCTGIQKEKWVVVERSLENQPSIKTILDSLQKEGYEKHYLEESFPAISADTISEINYWKLASQLAAKNLSGVVVFASNRLESFKGKRIALPSTIKWISAPLPEIDYPLHVIELNKDSIVLRIGHFNADETYFQSEKTDALSQSIPISLPDSIRILIISDDSYSYDRTMVVASLKAIEKTFLVKLKIVESNPSNFSPSNVDWCFWLSNVKIPENTSLQLISIRSKKSNYLLIHSKLKEWELTRRLNEEVALDANLTLHLAELIIPAKHLNEIASAKDRRMLPDSMAWAQVDLEKPENPILSSSADSILLILLLIILFVERIIAYNRNQ